MEESYVDHILKPFNMYALVRTLGHTTKITSIIVAPHGVLRFTESTRPPKAILSSHQPIIYLSPPPLEHMVKGENRRRPLYTTKTGSLR